MFQDLVTELERQGVSRKVSADMFGMGLRSYQRRVRRITESSVERGRSLWEAVLDYIRRQGITPRADILRAFAAEDDVLLRGVLFDLCESRLVFQAGQGAHVVYRAVSDDELGALRALRPGEGVDELVWTIVYREGPLTRDELLQRTHLERAELDGALGRLLMPLVLDFHTFGGTSAGEAAASGYREIAEREGFIVAWPQGIDGAWNIGPCCTTSRDVDDVAFARALVQDVQAEACVDARRVYAVGVANGGGMAYHLACNAADVFAGVAPSAFDLLTESEQPCRPARPVTVISFRGTADLLVPYEGGAQQAPNGAMITLLGAAGTFERWAELNQCAGSPVATDDSGCSTYSSCADGVEVALCTTQGGGMDWGDPEIGWATLKRHARP